MRGLRSTVALLVVLVGLSAYIYFHASKIDPLASNQERVFPQLASDDIEGMTVKNEAGEATTLEKQAGKWVVTAPTPTTRGSDMETSSLASSLSGLEVTRVIEEAPTDLKQYGLEPARIQVTFKSKAGKPSGTLLIGNKTSNGNSIYARREDSKRVFLVQEFNTATFNKSTFDLRDKAIVTVDTNVVDGVDVNFDSSTIEMAKKGSDWALVKPIVARADGSAVDGLVFGMSGLQMKSIVGTSATPDEMKRYGLDKPSAIINLHMGSARTSVAIGGPAGEDAVYAKDVAKPDIYTVAKSLADELKKKADDYRRKDLFDMRAFSATHIEITRSGKTTAFDKVKGTGDAPDTWKRVSPAGGDPDKDKFQAFVAALADIRALDFPDAKAKTGLDAPAATIVVKFDEGKREDRVTLAKPASDAFAARPDDPGAARIDQSQFDDAIKAIDEFTK